MLSDDPSSDYALISKAREYVVDLLHREGVNESFVDSWTEFFDQYDPLIRRFALTWGVGPGELQDCTQDVWAKILLDLPSLECDPRYGSFRAWLFVRVRSAAVNRFRDADRRLELPRGVTFSEFASSDPEPPSLFEQHWNEVVFQEALTTLERFIRETDYRLFVMRKLHELSISELAADSGLREEAVRWRISRTKRVFANILREFGYDELLFPEP